MTEVSVATWNLHQAMDKRPANMARTWRYLENEIRPTVALVQEADGVPDTRGGTVTERADDVRYETAVVGYSARVEPLPFVKSRYSRRHSFEISPRIPATFAAAQVIELSDARPFVAISMYGIMAPVYAQMGVLRAIADLIPLFDAPGFNRRIILGGDLNAYDQHPTDKVMRGRWTAILAMLESLGLVNLLKQSQPERGPLVGCPCKDPVCWHVETFRHRNAPAGKAGFFTTDYMFATRDLADRLVALEIWNDRPAVWELSDHCPLVARFDL